MNEEDLEKTRALNELTDLINQAENESNNASNGISDTKDASEIINIPDDINGEENKEELYNNLTNNGPKDKKEKKSIIKKFKEWWNKLSKKQKIIFISVAILILILLITLIIVLIVKKPKDQGRSDLPDVVLEADNYVYQNGTLTMLDKNGNSLGTYECQNKDEKKCYVAFVSNIEDQFDTPINKYSNDEIIKGRSQIYYDRYVFIFDNADENDEKILLYDMNDNKPLGDYYGVKSYNVENANAVILKDENDKYGLFEFTSNGLDTLIDFKYAYMGLIDKEKDNYIIVKDGRGYFLIDYSDKMVTKAYDSQIYDYNDTYVILKDDDKYSVFDYNGKEFVKNYDYIRIININYIAVVKDKKLYIRSYEDKKYNEEGYELVNDNYRTVNIFDNNKKLVDTNFAFELEVHDKTLSITIKTADGSKSDERLNLAEGDASATYDYYSYYNGKLYFYDDTDKTNIIGTYECNNKNNNIEDNKFNNCYVAKDSVFNDSYINPHVDKDAVIALYNKRYVFILDASDLQSGDSREIKFYDLSQNKVLGTYNAIDANMGQSVPKLTLVNTNDTKIIARLKSGKFGVIQIKGSEANVLQKFSYNYIERAGNDYIVQLENNNWQIIYGSNNYSSSEFSGRIKNYANGYVVTKNSNSNKDTLYKGDGTSLLSDYDYIDISNKTVFAAVKDSKLEIYTYDVKKINSDIISLKSNKYYNTSTPAYRISVNGNSVSVSIYNNDGTLAETLTYSISSEDNEG